MALVMATITAYNHSFFYNGRMIPAACSSQQTESFLSDVLPIMDIEQVMSAKSQKIHDRLLRNVGIELTSDRESEPVKVESFNYEDETANAHYLLGSFSGVFGI